MCKKFTIVESNPELVAQWHPILNLPLTPTDVTQGSSKEVWWQCEKGHVWQEKVYKRTKGLGCPYDAGKKGVREGYYKHLAVTHPLIVKEWHSEKNGKLTPEDVTGETNKKIWWRCDKGHEWEDDIKSRIGGRSCPYCESRIM